MVVEHCGQQVVGSADGVEVTGEVQIDVLHGDNLRVAAAGSAALDTEDGSQRGLPESDHYVLADPAHTVGQTHGSGGLAFTGGGGVDGGDEDQLAVGLVRHVLEDVVVNLCLVVAVLLQVLLVHTGGLGDLADVLHFGFLGDLDVSFESHFTSFSLYKYFVLPLEWRGHIQDLCGLP